MLFCTNYTWNVPETYFCYWHSKLFLTLYIGLHSSKMVTKLQRGNIVPVGLLIGYEPTSTLPLRTGISLNFRSGVADLEIGSADIFQHIFRVSWLHRLRQYSPWPLSALAGYYSALAGQLPAQELWLLASTASQLSQKATTSHGKCVCGIFSSSRTARCWKIAIIQSD